MLKQQKLGGSYTAPFPSFLIDKNEGNRYNWRVELLRFPLNPPHICGGGRGGEEGPSIGPYPKGGGKDPKGGLGNIKWTIFKN